MRKLLRLAWLPEPPTVLTRLLKLCWSEVSCALAAAEVAEEVPVAEELAEALEDALSC